MKHLIVTACDSKYGGFLTGHFLKSLVENVNLSNIDVAVIDYGLTPGQVKALTRNNVKIFYSKKDCHVVNCMLRDIPQIIDSGEYDQVMKVDGGDIIFQSAIHDAFTTNKTEIRITPEHINLSLNDFFINSLYPSYVRNASRLLKGKLSLNIGVMVGPAGKMKRLFTEAYDSIMKKDKFGPDQVAINNILYRDGFCELDSRFNFMPASTVEAFYIEDGEFFLADGNKIPIVHNAGGTSAFRCIHNFGYGEGHNKIKQIMLSGLRFVFNKENNGSNHIKIPLRTQ